jgi:hypothetical protein
MQVKIEIDGILAFAKETENRVIERRRVSNRKNRK